MTQTTNSLEGLPQSIKAPYIWNLGRHKLIWGDATNPDHRALLGSADMVFTDPPFDMPCKFVRDAIAPLSSQFAVAGNGREYIKLCNLKPFQFWFEHVGIRNQPRSRLGWSGPHIYHWNTAFLTLTKGQKHCFDRDLADGHFPSALRYQDAPQGNYAKPLKWAVNILSACHAQTITDPFSGSGTTLIACEKLGKNFTGMELSRERCLLTLKRFSNLSN